MDLILYHKDCTDGWAAAYIAKKKYPEAETIAIAHGDKPVSYDDINGKDVLMVDIVYPRAILLEMFQRAHSFRVIDHHKTAQEDLRGLGFASFDMNRSGAGLTWDLLMDGDPRPWWVTYVEARDLWRLDIPFARQICSYLQTLPYTIPAWDEISHFTNDDLETVVSMGEAIEMYKRYYVEKNVAQARIGSFENHKTAMVNASYISSSELGQELLKLPEVEVGMVYHEDERGYMVFGLRSKGNTDVSALAKLHGGGGHLNAAGFQYPYAEGRKLIDTILRRG